MLNNKKDIKRVNVISSLINDREYNIPDWVYKYIDTEVINKLCIINNTDIIKRYIDDINVRNFFDTIRDRVVIDKKSLIDLYRYEKGMYSALLFTNKDWKYMRKHIKNNTDKFFYMIIKYLLSDEIFIERTREILKIMKFKKEYIIKEIYDMMKGMNLKDIQMRMSFLLDILEVNNNYQLTQYCINLGIPVFFKYGDEVDLYNYLSLIIENSWSYNIDDNISNVQLEFGDPMCDDILHIFRYLNSSIIVQAKDMLSEEDFNTLFFSDTSISEVLGVKKDKYKSKYGIKDFNDLIRIFGNNPYGFPLWIQQAFIFNDGDIRTMFKNDELLPEASIIKSNDQLDFIICNLPMEDLRFLIYNSNEFVKNILTNRFTSSQTSLIRILKALFENPVNPELWNTLNHTSKDKTVVDFREVIINRIVSVMTLEGVFLNVPEAMLYITPSALFVTRNINNENIKFVPVVKLIPYIYSILTQNKYINLNKFYRGDYVSITKIMPIDELVKVIIQNERYGYIADILNVDHKKIIDKICSM